MHAKLLGVVPYRKDFLDPKVQGKCVCCKKPANGGVWDAVKKKAKPLCLSCYNDVVKPHGS